MQMTIISMFSPLPMTWFTATFPTPFQLFDMYLYLDMHWFLKPRMSWSELCFIAHKPISCHFFLYVNENITEQSLRLKNVPCSFVSILTWYLIMRHVKSILSLHFSIKLCPLNIHTCPLIQALNTCFLDTEVALQSISLSLV